MECTYRALPEEVCAALRSAHDGFGGVSIDHANFRLIAHTIDGDVAVSHGAAHEYIEAWRRSGLWALRGAIS